MLHKGDYTTVFNLFNSQKQSDPQQLVQVKSWVFQAFDLSEDISVMITQLQCTEEGCPPIENGHCNHGDTGKAPAIQNSQTVVRGKADRHR